MANHRLVAIGDSMTQGFMSGAIFATDLSYPTLIAREMGLSPAQFRAPGFAALGGLPVNIERLLRLLEAEYGPDLSRWDLLGAPFRIRGWMDEIEDHWERGPGTAPRVAQLYHNLAVWGYTVDDAIHLTAGHCAARLRDHPGTDDLLNQVPENAFARTALTVLNPSQDERLGGRTALGCARELAGDGGVENLIVNLGANNALGTITTLGPPALTDDRILGDPVGMRERFSLWRPEHFDRFFAELVAGIESVAAERVFVASVPHVTIAPIARGVGTTPGDRLEADPRYFKFYTRFYIKDESFEPGRHKHLTGEQARQVDGFIDRYNETIRRAVESRPNWHLVDIGGVLDRLAFRRFREAGLEPPGGRYEFPAGWDEALATSGMAELTTHFLRARENRRVQGGLFSLDGVHPTTMGYGLIAHEFIQVMRAAGVPFLNAADGRPRTDPVTIDFGRLLRLDTLVSSPPRTLDDVFGVAEWLDGWLHLGWILNTVHGTVGTNR